MPTVPPAPVAPKAVAKPAAKPAAKPVAKVPVKKPAKAEKPPRKVIHPNISICGILIPEEKLTTTEDRAKELLGWETETQYAERTGQTATGVSFGEPLLTDEEGNRVQCWHNLNNRPFKDRWCRLVASTILDGNWEMNCETIIISRTGEVLSGQHRLIALILACQMWRANPGKYPFWKGPPTIKTLVAYGCNEDNRVIRTHDNVAPRSLSDVFFTQGIWGDIVETGLEKKELSRMLGVAVDFLWKRTGVGGPGIYKSHPAAIDFHDRHSKLTDAVVQIFQENKERQLSVLGLSPGVCAGCLYLMAAGDTDGEAYRKGAPPSEELVEFKLWDKAKSFFVQLGKVGVAKTAAAKLALGAIAETEKGGRTVEKVIVLAKAFTRWLADEVVKDHLELMPTTETKNGKVQITDEACFGGIDVGHQDSGDDEDNNPSPAQIAEQARKTRAQQITEKITEMRGGKKPAATAPAATPKPAADPRTGQPTPLDELKTFHAEQAKAAPGCDTVILFKSRSGAVSALAGDADKVAKALGRNEVDILADGTKKVSLDPPSMASYVVKLNQAGLRVAMFSKVPTGKPGELKVHIEVLGDPKVMPKKPAAVPAKKPAAPAAKPAAPKPVARK